MMRANRSRTAQPLRGAETHSAMGAWGLGLTVVVLLMFVAGFASAALYLETGTPQAGGSDQSVGSGWPPSGIEVPGRGLALSALALLGAGGLALSWATQRLTRRSEQPAAILVAAGAGCWIAAALVLTADLRGVGFSFDEHAYTSVYWTLTVATIVFTVVGMVMASGVLVQMLTGVVDPGRHLELVVTAAYGWFIFASAAVMLGLVHLLPIAGGGP